VREAALERLDGSTFDLLVVGAGIIGARIAFEAAETGLSVALVDAGDFGGATSSASSKFVHGGFRYLARGNVQLVRQAQRERRALVDRVAPHLVRPMPVVWLPDHGRHYPESFVSGGLFLYRALGARGSNAARRITAAEARDLVPPLRVGREATCIMLPEAQTDDARLTLLTVKAAQAAGAVVANYTRAVDLHWHEGRVCAVLVAAEGKLLLTARALVNATGPWVDSLRRLEDPRARPLVRLSKGVHVVLDLDQPLRGGVAHYSADHRTTFAVPWHEMLLLGLTDSPYDGDPLDARAEPEQVSQLLHDAARLLPEELLGAHRIRYAFAGLRALPNGGGDTAVASREHVIRIGPQGMVSVAGGKLTTHRQIARETLRCLPVMVRPRAGPAASLPGAGAAPRLPDGVDPNVWAHLVSVYGGEAPALVPYLVNGGSRPIHPRGPDVWAQVHYARDNEWALTAEDIARRRTTLAVRGLLDPELCETLAVRTSNGVRTAARAGWAADS
jgi:glycerol-3-phosphate dehydrogenase